MHTFGYHKEAGLLVSLWSGTTNRDADFEEMIRCVRQLDADSLGRPRGPVFIDVVTPENPRPSATWRRRVADFQQELRCPRLFVSLVTESVLIRGLVTSLNWIIPRPECIALSVHPAFDAAARWAEEQRGEPLPLLHELFRQARARAETPR